MWASALGAYAQHLADAHKAADTIARRTETLQRFARWCAPATPLVASVELIEQFLGRYASAATRRAYDSDLRAFYRWAVARNVMARDPMIPIERPRVPKAMPRPFGEEDYARAIAEATDWRLRWGLVLAGTAGLRRSDIVRLRGEDLQLDAVPPVVVIRQGKGSKDRVVPLHPYAVAELRRAPRVGWLFPAKRDARRHMNPDYFSRLMRAHLDALGIDGNVHRGRHRFGTEMARVTNGNLLAVAEAMGHDSTRTSEIYTALTGIRIADAIAAMRPPDAA